MKRIALILTTICSLSYNLMADGGTPGIVGLTLPTTGVIDLHRHLMDKVNSNFSVIASTLQKSLLTAANTHYTTGTDFTQFKSDVAGSTLAITNRADNAAISTTALKGDINGVAVSTNALKGDINGVAVSTNALKGDINGIAISTANNFNGQTTSYAPAFATAQSTNGLASGSLFRASIILSTHIADHTITEVDIASNSISGYNIASGTITARELAPTGVSAAAYTNANITVGSDGRITTASNGSAGGAVNRSSSVIVGPLGTTGVDIASSTIDGWLEALRLCNASGLSSSTTGYGTITYNPGVYQMATTTIPAGIKLIGLSSAVWTPTAVTSQYSIYGDVCGMSFDAGNRAYTGRFMGFFAGAKFTKCKVTGGINAANNVSTPFLAINARANNITITDNEFSGMRQRDGTADVGDNSAFDFTQATGVIFARNCWKSTLNGTSLQGVGFAIRFSSSLMFYDNTFENTGSCFWYMMGGNRDVIIDRNKFVHSFASPTSAKPWITLQGNTTTLEQSTGAIVFSNNDLILEDSVETSNLIGTLGTTPLVNGIVISGNHVYKRNSSTGVFTFVNLAANSILTIIKDNITSGVATFLTDSGINTKSASLGNFKDGVEQ